MISILLALLGAFATALVVLVVTLRAAAFAPHRMYLRYVLRHKYFVYRAGRRLGVPRWRLLVHDLSKFSLTEWRAYAPYFYGEPAHETVLRYMGRVEMMSSDPEYHEFKRHLAIEKATRSARFDAAWLHHQHANPHHWQHWVLREDSGATKVLMMPAVLVAEMVADWIGAGTKILTPGITLDACALEALRWYAANRSVILLRGLTRDYVETLLIEAASWSGLAVEHFDDAEMAVQG